MDARRKIFRNRVNGVRRRGGFGERGGQADAVATLSRCCAVASIRRIYACLQQGTTDGQSECLVNISRDGALTREPLEYMGIAQALPDAYKNTSDFVVNNEGYGLPATRRLPYADYGLALAQAVTANPLPQTIQTASYGANRLGLTAGQFVFLDPGGANEEYVKVITADPDNQTFDAVVTKDHVGGERIRPTIWPTPVLVEGDDLAFDILAVASRDSGSDLTLVVQT